MKTTKFDGSAMRRVLAGMVMQRTVLARIASRWQSGGLFDSDWANLVAGWCIDYLEKYGDAPKKEISGLFRAWANETTAPDETIDAVDRFLSFASREYEQEDDHSPQYVLDVAGGLFNKTKLRAEIEEATDELDRGRVGDAVARLSEFRRIDLGIGSVIKPAEDFDAWVAAYDREEERPLIEYGQRLGRFVNGAFRRGGLVAIQAPDKTGKSWWLLDMAYRAAKSRRRVAYIDCGDMVEGDIVRRLGQRACGLPTREGSQRVPTGIDGDGKVEFKTKKFQDVVTARSGFKSFCRAVGGKDRLRISCHPNGTLSVSGVSAMVQEWEREDWSPDVIVLDYVDIMAPPVGVRDTLDQIDETWRGLRRLSQEMDCLVLTATQSNAAAYTQQNRTQGKRNFSGRKTKLAHVTAMLGLSQTDEEKGDGVWRINFVVDRNGKFTENAFVRVAGNLSLGRPSMVSGG